MFLIGLSTLNKADSSQGDLLINHRLNFVSSALLVLTIATLIANTYRAKAQLGQLPMQPVAPGDDMELILSDAKYAESKRFLISFGFPDTIRKVELKVIAVGFDDDTAWYSGKMYQRDAENIGEPDSLKGWAPIKEPDREPQERRSIGSTENRTALFSRANIRNLYFGASSHFLNATWLAPSIQASECGQAVSIGVGGCSSLPECQHALTTRTTYKGRM